jgi:excisionase family DNA binding protein
MVMEKLYTPEQAAEILQVTAAVVREWLKGGKLKGAKVAGHLWRIKESDLKVFLKGEKASTE